MIFILLFSSNLFISSFVCKYFYGKISYACVSDNNFSVFDFFKGNCEKKKMYFQQGIDIVEICRISKIYEKFGINFLIKVLTKQELKIIPTKKRRIDFVSGRFVAKEAIAKALGTDFEMD